MSAWRVIPETAGLAAIGLGLWWLSPAWALIIVGGLVCGASFLGRMRNDA